jgi:hypothetical protein
MRSVERPQPIWLGALLLPTGKDPIFGLVVWSFELPSPKNLCQFGIEWDRFCDASVLHGLILCFTTERLTRISKCSKSTSCHLRPSSFPTRKPLAASSRTAVRTGSLRFPGIVWICSMLRIVGTRERFALCRTAVIGLWRIHSHRVAWLDKALIMFLILALEPRESGSVLNHFSTCTDSTSPKRYDRQRLVEIGFVYVVDVRPQVHKGRRKWIESVVGQDHCLSVLQFGKCLEVSSSSQRSLNKLAAPIRRPPTNSRLWLNRSTSLVRFCIQFWG